MEADTLMASTASSGSVPRRGRPGRRFPVVRWTLTERSIRTELDIFNLIRHGDGFLVGDDRAKLRESFASSLRNEAKLGKVGSECIDQLRALTDQKIPCSMQHK